MDIIPNEGFPRKAGSEPICVNAEAGKIYAWCTCGLSAKQPFCDGAHRKIETTTNEQGEVVMPYKSMRVEITEAQDVWFCTCKMTKNPPYCDGSHKGEL